MKRSILYIFFLFAAVDFVSAQTVNPVLWERKEGPTGGEITDIQYDPTSGRTFAIAGSDRRLYISVDDGESWTDQSVPNSSFNYFNDIEVVGSSIYLTTSYDIWLSIDGGDNWNQISSNVSAFNNANKIIKLSTGRLVVLGNSGVHYSTNNGTSWATGPTMTGSINTRYLVKTSANQIFILKDNKPFRSNDLGVNFVEFSTNLPGGYQAMSLYADNTGTNLYLVTADNIWVSNGTAGWATVKGGSISDATISSFSSFPSVIEFSEDGLGMFFVDNVNHKLHAKLVSGAASTWTLRQTSFPTATTAVENATSKEFPTAATSTALFGTHTGIVKTTNGATTYSDANAFISGIDADDILFDVTSGGDGNLMMLTTNRTTILKSTNGGDTWSKISGFTGSVNSFVQNIGRNTIYLSTTTGAFRSSNAGTNWTAVTISGAGVDKFIPADEDKVFALYGNSLYYSSNKGVSFSATPVVVSGLPASFSMGTVLAASATRMLVRLYDFNTSSNKVYKIIFVYSGTTITSATASQVTTPVTIVPNDINKMYAVNGNFYLYNPYSNPDQLAVSTDAGASWSVYNLANAEDVFVAHNGYIFVPSYGPQRVLISRDNGATFQETNIDKEQLYNAEGVAISYDGKAHIAFDNDFVYNTTKNIVLPDAVPSNLAEVGKSGTAVSLAWDDNSTNENDFEIFQSTNGVDFVKSGETSDYCNTPNDRDFFVATGLLPNTNYTFRVRAINDAGSTATIQKSVTTLNTASCTQTIPDNRSWSAVNTNPSGLGLVAPKTVNIRHISGGKYQITDASLGTLTAFSSTSDPATFFESCGQTFLVSSNDDDLKSDGNGTWNGTNTITLKWRACAADEFEVINITLSATDPAPSTPTSVNAYNLTNTSIEVNWLAGSYDKTYVIERSTLPGSGFVQVGTTTYPTTKLIDNTSLVAGTTYYYRVKARNANTPTPLESAFSANATIVFSTPKFIVPANTVTNYVAATVGSYWADFNNDGFDDYFTLSFDPVTEKGSPIFFRNTGSGDFVLTIPSGISGEAYFFATAVDYDNDGFQDIAFAGQEDQLLDVYRGNGDFTFVKMGAALGDLNSVISENIEIETISWGDINNDGLLDLAVAGEIPNASESATLFYKQNTDHTFTKWYPGELSDDTDDVTGIAWADYNNDGYSDVLLINSNGPFRLYENNHDDTFTKKIGSNLNAQNAITACWGDYNNDGFVDLYVGTFTNNTLYKNNGNETFTAEGATSVSEASQVISAAWGDFNNDGFLDLVTGAFGTSVTRLFMRDATAPSSTIFTKIVNEKLNDLSTSHYGVSTADYDNNGSLDVAMSSFTFGVTNDEIGLVNTNLFRNNVATANWSEVKLVPTAGNKSGVGATIKLTAGGVTQTRQIQSATTFVSKSGYRAHFGIGNNASITNIQVKWANGDVQNYPNAPINQILTIDQDLIAPAPTTFSPANNAVGISPTTQVTITLDQESFAVAGKFLMVYLNSNLSSPVFGVDLANAVKSGNQFTFTLPQTLLPGTKYNIGVDAGAFIDKYANGSAEMPTGLWSFTTAAGPAITLLSPVHNSTNVAANTQLQITFDKNVAATAAKRLKIMDGSTTVVDVDVSTSGTVTNAVYTFQPGSKLPTNKLLKATLDAGAFKDAATQADAGAIVTDSWNFTIAPGPAVTALLPANAATGVAVRPQLQITFDNNVTAVATKHLKIMDGATVLVDIDVATSGAVANNSYTFTPVADLPNDKLLKVIVDVGAFVDATKQTDFAGIAVDSWNFRTVLAADATPPTMTFIPPLTAAKGFTNLVSPEITVTDDRGTVSSVVISIKKLTAASTTFVDVPAIQGTGANANKWVFTISESNHFDAIGTEYFITAKDPANNAVRSPATDGATHKLFLTYTANESKIPSDKLGFGGALSNWKVFSIPFDLGVNNSFTSVFNELDGKENKVDYRFLTIQPTSNTNWTEYPSFTTITRGQGYFSNIKTPVDILLGALQAPENSRTNLFTITLKAGWNMVGNPYLTQISWANVKDFNGLTGQVAELHKFNGTNYPVNVQTLDPYEGGFIFAQADRTVTIPFIGQIASGGRIGYEELSDDINNSEWLLKLNVRQNNVVNDLGSVGMAPDAKMSLDDYDGVTPPRFFDYLETNFAHPEHFAKRFTRDVVPTQNEYTWNFSVDSNLEGEAEIFWDNTAFANGTKEIFLFDQSRQRLIDMRAVSSYSFNPKESINFKVYFGENLKIAPEAVLLGKAFPNPTSGHTNIAFSLPDSGGQNQFVTLEILDATGRTMGTIAQGRYQPGFYEAALNAKELNNGFYTYRLTVQNSRGRNTLVNKLIIK